MGAETEVWKGLEHIEERYKNLGDKRGATLYGVMGCRLCLKKRLNEVFDAWWEKAVEMILQSGEKVYLGELFLLKKRRLKLMDNVEEAAIWEHKMKEWMNETGGCLLDSM